MPRRAMSSTAPKANHPPKELRPSATTRRRIMTDTTLPFVDRPAACVSPSTGRGLKDRPVTTAPTTTHKLTPTKSAASRSHRRGHGSTLVTQTAELGLSGPWSWGTSERSLISPSCQDRGEITATPPESSTTTGTSRPLFVGSRGLTPPCPSRGRCTVTRPWLYGSREYLAGERP